MIVVSNTSPINYLLLIDHLDVIQQLFGGVFVPQAVCDELSRSYSPAVVRQWAINLPEWVEVRHADVPDDLSDLHNGESETIALAGELTADLVLLDERKASKIARTRGLVVTGTLGVLGKAFAQDLIDLDEAFDRLKDTSFYVDPQLLREILAREKTKRQDTGSSE